MPTASILTITTPENLGRSSPTTLNIPFDVETKYLDADVDFFDIASPHLLTVPAAPTVPAGTIYEVFWWLEDTGREWGTGGGCYMGLNTNLTGRRSWGIVQNIGHFSYGVRTGPIEHDGTATNFWSQIREFESHTAEPDERSRFGILLGNPIPKAVASARDGSWSNGGGTNTVMNLAEEFDYGDCYEPVTGKYIAPAGATLAVANLTAYYWGSWIASRATYYLNKNGVAIAEYGAEHSERATGPGTFGLFEVSPGDEITMSISDTHSRILRIAHSVEFY